MFVELPSGERVSVAVTSRQLFVRGKPAKACHEQNRILIESSVNKGDRLGVLRHELWHAWADVYGEPDAGESMARAVTAFGDWFDSAVDRSALEALRHEPEGIERRPVAWGLTDRAECPCCGSSVMCGSILRGEPYYSDAHKGYAVERTAVCGCGTVWRWHETSSSGGVALGSILTEPKPRVLEGDEKREWLCEHEDVAGLVLA